LTVCFVQRGHRKRIISARKATSREQNDYNEANSPSQSDNRRERAWHDAREVGSPALQNERSGPG
jgi:hypothetical protein